MKLLCSAFLSICLFSFAPTTAAPSTFSDRYFDQQHIITTTYSIMILSSYETQDQITAYNDYGTLIWNVNFTPKVISWTLKDGLLFVFSKARYVEQTYLSCIDPSTGQTLWQRP